MDEGAFGGRVALVTGGSGGIGAAVCRRLAAEGAAVAVGYGRRAHQAEAVVAAVDAAGGRAVAVAGDLRDPAGCEAVAGAAEDALGPVDLLVAGAGISRPATAAQVDADAWDETLA